MRNNLKAEIAREIYRALDELCADTQLLGIIGSHSETLSDDQVLAYLKAFNRDGTMFSHVICSADDAAIN